MKCLICQSSVSNNYLAIWGEVICAKCEVQLMQPNVDDAEYELQILAFKRLWQREFSALFDRHPVDGE